MDRQAILSLELSGRGRPTGIFHANVGNRTDGAQLGIAYHL
jgi:hypothetical protein